jgi:hypothetical protein
MNEKIRELHAQSVTRRRKSADGKTWAEYTEFDHKKFAELIVRECLKFECEAGVYTKHDMADAIKRHFGVEP